MAENFCTTVFHFVEGHHFICIDSNLAVDIVHGWHLVQITY